MPKSKFEIRKKGSKNGYNGNMKDYSYLDLVINDDDSLNESIHDLSRLISKINKQTDALMVSYASDSDTDNQSELESDNEYRNDFDRNPSNLPANSQITQYLSRYREQITKLSAENKTLRKQLASFKSNLNKDLTKISNKLQKVKFKQESNMKK
jgi:hypothetical protein